MAPAITSQTEYFRFSKKSSVCYTHRLHAYKNRLQSMVWCLKKISKYSIMKTVRQLAFVLAFISLLIGGCKSLNKTQKGGAVGAVGGGVIGDVIAIKRIDIRRARRGVVCPEINRSVDHGDVCGVAQEFLCIHG